MFPRFEIRYADGTVVRGGGSEDTEMVTLTFPRSWIEAPGDGVVTVFVENATAGRIALHPHERYYCIPPECEGGPDFGFTEPEAGLGPYVRGQLKIVKEGLWVNDEKYRRIVAEAKSSDFANLQTSGHPRHNFKARD